MGASRLSGAQMVSYGLPAFGAALVLISVAVYLPNYYTDDLGLSAGLLGWVLLVGRLWDAVTDPLMGYVSDRTRSRLGRRRPYFLLATLPLWLAFYLTWAPEEGLSPRALFVHVLLAYLVLYTFWTVFWVPYISLGMELTPDYHERTRLFGVRQAFFLLGMAGGMLLPELFARAAGGPAGGYPRMAALFGGVCCALILVAFARLRERPRASLEHAPLVAGLRITFRNRAFVILMLTYLAALVGGSFIAPLTLYVAKYVIVAREVVPFVMLSYLVGSVLSIPLWVRLSARRGKNATWTAGMLLATAVYTTSFYYHEGTWELWVVLAALIGAAHGCTTPLAHGRRHRLRSARDRPASGGGLHGDLVLPRQGRRGDRDLRGAPGARAGGLPAQPGAAAGGRAGHQAPLLHPAGPLLSRRDPPVPPLSAHAGGARADSRRARRPDGTRDSVTRGVRPLRHRLRLARRQAASV